MRYITVLVFFTCMYKFGEPANILGVFPLAGKSHFLMFERLLKGLAEKGHNVDVATHFPSKNTPPRYNQLSLVGSLPILVNNITFSVFEGFSHYDLEKFIVENCGVDACQATLRSPALQNLKTANKKYDLVITELFGSDCMLGFGYYYKAPIISLTSSVNLPWGGDRIGNPDNPSYIPSYFITSSDRMSLLERIDNTLNIIKSKFLYDYFGSKKSNEVAREFFGPDLPPLEELVLNTSLILVNSHFSMNYPRPTVPNFIEVGGLHIEEPKPLSKHFEDLMSSSDKGVIYLTMGSMMMTETFDPAILQGMFDAFAQFPSYTVLWKGVRENFPKGLKIPANIHFENWMPQMDILCHPKVKLFVSHGGLMGSQEAVYCGVPRFAIPLFGDQYHNVISAETRGLAIKVDFYNISKESILHAATELLENPFYKDNCEKASRYFKDRPMTALDTAIYWVEYVIRHNGAPQLRTAGADLPWYQYYLVDVGIVLISVFLAFMYISFCLVGLVCQIIKSSMRKNKQD